jgi:chondroitin AC lyase
MKHFTILFFLGFLIIRPAFGEPSSLEIIQSRINEDLLRSEVNNSEIEELVGSIRGDGTWPGLNYEDLSRTGFEHRQYTLNLVQLARAYKDPQSRFFQKQEIFAALELGLQHWVAHDYLSDNWWHNQIGTPGLLADVLLLLGDQIDPVLRRQMQPILSRANLEAPGARPGGDRIKIAGIQTKQALANGDLASFASTLHIIESEIKFSDWVGLPFGYGFRDIQGGLGVFEMNGRGIQHDLSFKHRVDGVNSTLSYGITYASAFAEWGRYVAGTDFAFSEEKSNLLTDYFLDGICRMKVFGKYPDPGAVNRSLSRVGRLQPYSSELPRQLASISDYRQAELQEIIAIRENRKEPSLSHATYYWQSDHVSIQRPSWFASVRLFSTRNNNTEDPYNSEGLLDHHRGDGANFLTVHAGEFYDIWPVYDFQKIPGTTIVQQTHQPGPEEIRKLGLKDFVGAATDEIYAVVATDFRSPHAPLIARKSWFFFKDQYVCLGAGISSHTPDQPVVTTLNQTHLLGEISLLADGERVSPPRGSQHYEGVNWLHHDQVGYAFPTPTSIDLFHGPRAGSWERISKQTSIPKDAIELDIFELSLGHGIQPSDANYAYVVYPATGLEDFEQAVAKQEISILRNSPELQAVRNHDPLMGQAVFYRAGQVELLEGIIVHASAPCLLIRRA